MTLPVFFVVFFYKFTCCSFVHKTCSKRKREPAVLSFEESERRALLHKDWTRYKTKQHNKEIMAVARVHGSQQRALEELRKESEELYQSAIQV